MVTPEGDYAIPTTFNAADLTAADAGGVPIGTGAFIEPVGSQTIDAITGIAPLAMADDGTQLFNVEDASGHVIGSFNAEDTITGDRGAAEAVSGRPREQPGTRRVSSSR